MLSFYSLLGRTVEECEDHFGELLSWVGEERGLSMDDLISAAINAYYEEQEWREKH